MTTHYDTAMDFLRRHFAGFGGKFDGAGFGPGRDRDIAEALQAQNWLWRDEFGMYRLMPHMLPAE